MLPPRQTKGLRFLLGVFRMMAQSTNIAWCCGVESWTIKNSYLVQLMGYGLQQNNMYSFFRFFKYGATPTSYKASSSMTSIAGYAFAIDR